MIQIKRHQIGDKVRVHHTERIRLPMGLPEGVDARLVGAIYDYRLVEWQGEIFEVDFTNLDGGGEAGAGLHRSGPPLL